MSASSSRLRPGRERQLRARRAGARPVQPCNVIGRCDGRRRPTAIRLSIATSSRAPAPKNPATSGTWPAAEPASSASAARAERDARRPGPTRPRRLPRRCPAPARRPGARAASVRRRPRSVQRTAASDADDAGRDASREVARGDVQEHLARADRVDPPRAQAEHEQRCRRRGPPQAQQAARRPTARRLPRGTGGGCPPPEKPTARSVPISADPLLDAQPEEQRRQQHGRGDQEEAEVDEVLAEVRRAARGVEARGAHGVTTKPAASVVSRARQCRGRHGAARSLASASDSGTPGGSATRTDVDGPNRLRQSACPRPSVTNAFGVARYVVQYSSSAGRMRREVQRERRVPVAHALRVGDARHVRRERRVDVAADGHDARQRKRRRLGREAPVVVPAEVLDVDGVTGLRRELPPRPLVQPDRLVGAGRPSAGLAGPDPAGRPSARPGRDRRRR